MEERMSVRSLTEEERRILEALRDPEKGERLRLGFEFAFRGDVDCE